MTEQPHITRLRHQLRAHFQWEIRSREAILKAATARVEKLTTEDWAIDPSDESSAGWGPIFRAEAASKRQASTLIEAKADKVTAQAALRRITSLPLFLQDETPSGTGFAFLVAKWFFNHEMDALHQSTISTLEESGEDIHHIFGADSIEGSAEYRGAAIHFQEMHDVRERNRSMQNLYQEFSILLIEAIWTRIPATRFERFCSEVLMTSLYRGVAKRAYPQEYIFHV